jgi:hypothetical protein
MNRRIVTLGAAALILLAWAAGATAAEFLVGAASVDITPKEPVALAGQFHVRIARSVESPVTANALVLESREGDKSLDMAVLVSCDLVSIQTDVVGLVREKAKQQLPDLDVQKIVLHATHTHTAPVIAIGGYELPKEGVIQIDAYQQFFADRVVEAITQAWNGRKPATVSWGLSDALVAYNRRAVYANGSAQMYGKTAVPEFRNLEGYEDHDINTLFFWNKENELIAVAVNVACPSQEVEGLSVVNADFWHPVREALRKQYGSQLCVFGWTGAAGDQSPHLMYRKEADERMRRLRGLSRLDEIARRIVRAVNEAYEVVQNDRHADVPLVHQVETLQLPMRLVTEAEYAEAQAACQKLQEQIDKDPKAASRLDRRLKWYQRTIDRFEKQKTDPKPIYETEIHVLRLGDVAIATNQFELFTDYGIRMRARSKAVQTFLIQLAGPGTYLPTEKAVKGGGYSAVVQSSRVGPEGGQLLVERTVELINAMWSKPEK